MRQFRAAVASAPESVAARVYLADLLAQTGDFDSAILEYRELLARTPEYAHAYLGLGTALGRVNRHEEAIEALRAAAERDRYNPVIYYNLGGSYVATGKLQDALVAYRRAVNLQADDPDFVTNLGAILGDLRHWEDAVPVLERALSLQPNFNAAHNLAVARYELGRYAEAEDAFRQALRLEKMPSAESEPPHTAVRLALAIREQGRHDEAIAILDSLSNQEPENAIALVALAETYLGADRIEDGLRTARASVDRFPVFPDAHGVLGWALIEAQSPFAARECFERGLRLAPDDVYCLAGLGVALSVLGDQVGARAHFDEVARRDSEYFTQRPDLAEYVSNSRSAVMEARRERFE